MIIDGEVVVTGSFNFSRAAEEENAVNLLVNRDKVLAEKYLDNCQQHAKHSEVYKGRGNRYIEGLQLLQYMTLRVIGVKED